MTLYSIPSLVPSDRVVIRSLPSSDIFVGSQHGEKYSEFAYLRIPYMSRYEGWMKQQPYAFFMALKNLQDDVTQLQNGIINSETSEVITFPDDNNQSCLSVIKSDSGLFGVQVFTDNWQERHEHVAPVWLGQCNKDEGARETLLNNFYEDCKDLYTKWSSRGKPIRKMTQLTQSLDKPLILE